MAISQRYVDAQGSHFGIALGRGVPTILLVLISSEVL